MKQLIGALIFPVFCATAGFAQDVPFASYAAFERYLEKSFQKREFGAMVERLGGADEYTPQQLAHLDGQFKQLTPQDLNRSDLLRRREMGGGFTQEARVYWSDNEVGYVFTYFLLHKRKDGLLVVNFKFNTDADAVLSHF